jgi:hypothetical protein
MIEEAIADGLNMVSAAVRVRGVPCVIPEIASIEEKVAADMNV